MMMNSYTTNEIAVQEAMELEAAELKVIEDSLIERAYSGRSLYKLVTVETRLLILLL